MGSLGGLSPGGSIALGIIVGLMSTSVQSLGLTLQRKSHMLEDEKGPDDVRRPPHRRRRWQLGMGMFIIANILGSSVQISMLPLPVLSTLQASGLVFNSICATLILGEPFTRWSLWGTLLVCTGAVLIALFGAIPSPAHKLEELLDLLGRQAFVLWMSLQAVVVLVMAVTTELASRLPRLSQSPQFRLIRGLAYGCISGILSAHALLVAKSAVELVLRTITDQDNQFVHWQSWALVLGLVTLALVQLYYLHRGLKLVSTSVLYPLVFCIYNIIAILDGLIYFHQTSLITPLDACLITLGTIILLSGVLALSWRLGDDQHAPAVGQSTLAPGLGFVDDTEEEDEDAEELLLSSDIGEEEDMLQPWYSYDTFSPVTTNEAVSNGAPFSPPPKKSTSSALKPPGSRWTERAEILGELEDGDKPEPAIQTVNRRWSGTVPTQNEATALLHSRQRSSGILPTIPDGVRPHAGGSDQPPSDNQRYTRRRRRSTGFPGFAARKMPRRQGSGRFQDALGALWNRRRWQWTSSQPTTGTAWQPFAWARYRDSDPEAGSSESVGVTAST